MTLKVPPASTEAVRNVMVANTSKNTKPEMIVRKMLRAAGYSGYRLHWRINDDSGRYLCRPDITYPGKKLALFVHGCFWHRCPQCDLELPKSNVDYWKAKFEKNVDRDRRKEQSLIGLGWIVWTIWECDINQGVAEFADFLSEQ